MITDTTKYFRYFIFVVPKYKYFKHLIFVLKIYYKYFPKVISNDLNNLYLKSNILTNRYIIENIFLIKYSFVKFNYCAYKHFIIQFIHLRNIFCENSRKCLKHNFKRLLVLFKFYINQFHLCIPGFWKLPVNKFLSNFYIDGEYSCIPGSWKLPVTKCIFSKLDLPGIDMRYNFFRFPLLNVFWIYLLHVLESIFIKYNTILLFLQGIFVNMHETFMFPCRSIYFMFKYDLILTRIIVKSYTRNLYQKVL